MRHLRVILWICLLSVSLCAQSDYTIVNFDKLLTGTDKMIYVYPPAGKSWLILQGSTSLEQIQPELTFVLWLENAPYAPYRDPITGEMRGCARCVTLQREIADKVLFRFKTPILVSYPNRLMIAFTPPHGGLDAPLMTYTRLQVIEHDLPPVL